MTTTKQLLLILGIMVFIFCAYFLASCVDKNTDNGQSNVKVTETINPVQTPSEPEVVEEIVTIEKIGIDGGYGTIYIITHKNGHQFIGATSSTSPVHIIGCDQCIKDQEVQITIAQMNGQKQITEILKKQKDILKEELSEDDYDRVIKRFKEIL